MKDFLVAANWKLQKTHEEVKPFFEEWASLVEDKHDYAFFGSAMLIPAMADAAKNTSQKFSYGPQNVYSELSGAFTGENSLTQAKALGCDMVLVGHSERRQLFGEADELINQKVKLALAEGFHVILCLGETLEERESGKTNEVILRQLKEGLKGIQQDCNQLTLAYEPVWAIGTGQVATPEQANEAHAVLREALADKKIRILYGGSVKPANAAELSAQPEINGFLVGGASLKPADFAPICNV
jgi:triosephosphate isomerase